MICKDTILKKKITKMYDRFHDYFANIGQLSTFIKFDFLRNTDYLPNYCVIYKVTIKNGLIKIFSNYSSNNLVFM